MQFTNDDVFRLVGRICIVYATWDLITTLVILRLVKPTAQIPKGFSRKTLGQKLTYVSRLTTDDVIDGEMLESIGKALPTALDVAEKRNRFVHDLWVLDSTKVSKGELTLLSIEVATTSAGRGIHLPETRLSMADLCSLNDQVLHQQQIFSEWARKLGVFKSPAGKGHS